MTKTKKLNYINKEDLQETKDQILKLDDTMKLILKATLDDFSRVDVDDDEPIIISIKNVLQTGTINTLSDYNILMNHFSEIVIDGYYYCKEDFIKWFNIKNFKEFKKLREKYYYKKDYNKSFYFDFFIMYHKLRKVDFFVFDKTFYILEEIKNHNNIINVA